MGYAVAFVAGCAYWAFITGKRGKLVGDCDYYGREETP